MERKQQKDKEKSEVTVNNFYPNLADLSAFVHLVGTNKPWGNKPEFHEAFVVPESDLEPKGEPLVVKYVPRRVGEVAVWTPWIEKPQTILRDNDLPRKEA